jgi:hypothetical protein
MRMRVLIAVDEFALRAKLAAVDPTSAGDAATATIVEGVREMAGTLNVDFVVPIIVEAKTGPTWADAH